MNRDREQIPRKPAFGAAMPRDLQLHALPGVERSSCPDDMVSLLLSLVLQCVSVTTALSALTCEPRPYICRHILHCRNRAEPEKVTWSPSRRALSRVLIAAFRCSGSMFTCCNIDINFKVLLRSNTECSGT